MKKRKVEGRTGKESEERRRRGCNNFNTPLSLCLREERDNGKEGEIMKGERY